MNKNKQFLNLKVAGKKIYKNLQKQKLHFFVLFWLDHDLSRLSSQDAVANSGGNHNRSDQLAHHVFQDFCFFWSCLVSYKIQNNTIKKQ